MKSFHLEQLSAVLAFIKTADKHVFVYSATRWTISVVRPFGKVRTSFDFALSSSSPSSPLLALLYFAGSKETVRTGLAFVRPLAVFDL